MAVARVEVGEAELGADPLVDVLGERLGELDAEAVQADVVVVAVGGEPGARDLRGALADGHHLEADHVALGLARIAQEVDSMFVNTDAPTKTESEREFAASFETMMGGVKQFLYGIMAAITFSLVLVMGNTMAMTVRERTKEVGTLKAIGFKRHTIAGLFLGESLLLAVIGAAIGIGGAALLFRSIDMSLYIPNLVSFVPETETLIGAFVLAILVGIVSVVYSTYRVTGLTIAEALRSTE